MRYLIIICPVACLLLFIGCDWGESVSPKEIPIVITAGISDFTQTTAKGGGEVTEVGGSAVIERGVVWDTNRQPTRTVNDGYTTDGSGTGWFTSNITGLQPETQYFVRAYATNSEGTAYGDQVRFVTAGIVTDIDGNDYKTVKIGDQWWMAENLRTTRYRNGEAIPTNLDNPEWKSTQSGAYAIYPDTLVDRINSDTEMLEAYGALYSGYAVSDSRGVCPEGWKVPSQDEWTTLVNYLGGRDVAGGKLKSTRTDPDPHPRWNNPNTGATDQSSFSALPGGYRGYEGNYYAVGSGGYWWTSTDYMRNIHHGSRPVYINWNFANGGISVRCLRE